MLFLLFHNFAVPLTDNFNFFKSCYISKKNMFKFCLAYHAMTFSVFHWCFCYLDKICWSRMIACFCCVYNFSKTIFIYINFIIDFPLSQYQMSCAMHCGKLYSTVFSVHWILNILCNVIGHLSTNLHTAAKLRVNTLFAQCYYDCPCAVGFCVASSCI